MTSKTELISRLEQVLTTLNQLQKPSGEFQTQESFPMDYPEPIWFAGVSSPFITSSVLLSLYEIEHVYAGNIKMKGARFLQNTVELNNLWRFWSNAQGLNKVPLDTDDTAVCSFLLEQILDKHIDNKGILFDNMNADGLFYTWFFPRSVFLKYPLLFFRFAKDKWEIRNTIRQKMLSESDYEIAVIANVLLYLGESEKTRKSIDYVIDTLKNNKLYELQFYDEPVFVWYHVSRAYNHAVKGFAELKDSFIHFYLEKISAIDWKIDLPLLPVLANTCYNFGMESMCEELTDLLMGKDIPEKLNIPYGYFTSKNRRYKAGSSALTLSWYAEYLNNRINKLN